MNYPRATLQRGREGGGCVTRTISAASSGQRDYECGAVTSKVIASKLSLWIREREAKKRDCAEWKEIQAGIQKMAWPRRGGGKSFSAIRHSVDVLAPWESEEIKQLKKNKGRTRAGEKWFCRSSSFESYFDFTKQELKLIETMARARNGGNFVLLPLSLCFSAFFHPCDTSLIFC